MSFTKSFIAALAAGFLALPAVAEGVMVVDPYARASSPAARSGAVFMTLHNMGSGADRLIGAFSDAAERVALHTHVEAGDGIVQMREIEDGIDLPVGGMHGMVRGGDHLMLMGLTGPLEQGDSIELTLIFEDSGEVVVTVPVDNERAPEAGAHSH